jgi:hypothetical protein
MVVEDVLEVCAEEVLVRWQVSGFETGIWDGCSWAALATRRHPMSIKGMNLVMIM